MHLENVLLMIAIGVASNLDNAGVGVAYGIKKIKVPFVANSIIAFIGFLFALLGGLFGNWVSIWLSPFVCNIIGMIVLVTIGVWVLSQPYIEKRVKHRPSNRNLLLQILQNPEDADLDGSKSVGLLESLLLGVALSINNLAGGFDTGITHLNIWITSLISGVFSYVCVGVCAYLGSRVSGERLGRQASFIAGIILILVGLHQVF
ncbi:sporulation membrane protein YtaF [Heyndrickxia acidicola]|uniref:Sporulation membrane protein YtaF n=1 Tax=Heyndrickxia acidicola TaxID=209389 RepID=A0ABU6MKP8_9BACI|nr:sporulation membrane protein YtaF [Heyndrickxia acidicola]MED1203625.1 sporulation membrane protein YtaF [Heyndrickxia acidicola]